MAEPDRQRGGQLYECDTCALVQCAKGGPTHPEGIGDNCFCSSWESRDEAYPGCYVRKAALPSCQTCVYHDWKIGPCAAPKGSDKFPHCYKGHDGEAPSEHEYVGSIPIEEAMMERPKCKSCRKHNEEHGWCMDSSMVYPECYKERKTKADKPLCKTCCYDCGSLRPHFYPDCHEKKGPWEHARQRRRLKLGLGRYVACELCGHLGDMGICRQGMPPRDGPHCHSNPGIAAKWKAEEAKPLCATCACYEAESGHCTEFAGNHYPE